MTKKTEAKALTPALMKGWPLPDPGAEAAPGNEGKEARGRVLVVGGGCRCPGSVELAAVAALRAGAGKLQMAAAHDAAMHLALSVPEARVMACAATRVARSRNRARMSTPARNSPTRSSWARAWKWRRRRGSWPIT